MSLNLAARSRRRGWCLDTKHTLLDSQNGCGPLVALTVRWTGVLWALQGGQEKGPQRVWAHPASWGHQVPCALLVTASGRHCTDDPLGPSFPYHISHS